MFPIIILLLLLVPYARSGCSYLDHQACDELCKVDSFWYGHCSGWDGFNFSCKCYEYQTPLDGKMCVSRQSRCDEKCKEQGSEGGFCFPQRDANGTARTACECFKQFLSRKRRSIYKM